MRMRYLAGSRYANEVCRITIKLQLNQGKSRLILHYMQLILLINANDLIA